MDAAGADEISAVTGAAAADVDAVPGQLTAAVPERRPVVLPVVVVAPLGGPDRECRLDHLADGRSERRERARPVLIDAEQAAQLARDPEVPRAVGELGADKPGAERGEPGPLAARVLPPLAVALPVRSAALGAAGVVDGEHVQAVPVLQPAGHGEDVGSAHAARLPSVLEETATM